VCYPYGRNVEDAKKKLEYDSEYIEHWSLLMELKVIFKTIKVVLGKEGM
jgi:lipopolysaccharide/colanic/teichoic acid biosynthesis glycosyltransferase